jgi:succinoglycan biosynthesis transport protein ExoP
MGKNEIGPTGANPVWQVRDQTALAGIAPPAEGAPVSSGSDLNLANLLRIASEWRWIILGAVAVGIAIALVMTLLQTPMYRSQAVLEMNPPAVQVLGQGKGDMPMVSSERDFLPTQYGLLKSRSLAERVAQELNLGANPAFAPPEADRAVRNRVAAGRLMGGFNVNPVPNSRLVNITYSAEDPALAARIANAYADSFINANLERRYESSSYARRFLQQQINRLKGELENTERRLVAYAQQQGLIATPSAGGGGEGAQGGGGGGGSLTGASLGALNTSLAEATTRRIAAEERYRSSLNANQTAEINERIAPLRNQQAALQAEYQEKLTTFRPDYPDMVRLRTRLDAIERTIQAETNRTAGGRSNTYLAEFRAAANEERTLQSRVNALKGAVLDERGRSIQYNILQRELDANRGLYDALLQRYREIGISGGVGTNTVSIVDRAEPAGAPYTPDLTLNLMIGAALGFMLGALAALGLDILNDVIKTPDDVRQKLGLASLGMIPQKAGNAPFMDDLKDRTSAVSEAYFSLSSALQFTSETGTPKSLLITSSRAAEGKSSTTLALAQNFARLGNRVLLVDADLRKPAFVTGLDSGEGLSKLLTNSDPLSAHVLDTEFENLTLLPCGPLPPNPAELLASTRLKSVIAEAMQQYDLVIVDGPPVLGLADAPLLASVCRATLLVVESGKTRTRAALDAVVRLRGAGANLVGAVLTKYRARAHGYGYGYGYSYEPYRYGGIGSREREIKLIARREA